MFEGTNYANHNLANFIISAQEQQLLRKPLGSTGKIKITCLFSRGGSTWSYLLSFSSHSSALLWVSSEAEEQVGEMHKRLVIKVNIFELKKNYSETKH